VLIHCDRCHLEVEGSIDQPMSAGVYVVTGWQEFMDQGEYVICDQCMWADERYRKIYGVYT
jgi:hypothetical protein